VTLFFQVVTSCRLVGRYQPTSLHNATIQNSNIVIKKDVCLLGCYAVWYKVTEVSEVFTASIIRAINFYQTTRCDIPEGSRLHTRHRENLKSRPSIRVKVRLLEEADIGIGHIK
jgi:hypothetical protein